MAIIFEPVTFAGLDIGETQVRVIQLEQKEKSAPQLIAAGSINLRDGDKPLGEKVEAEQVGQKIAQLIEEVGILTTNVAIALPESEVYTRIIEVPNISPEEIAQTIQYEAESYVPFPIDEVQLDWQLLEEPAPVEGQPAAEKRHALLVAAPLVAIQQQLDIVEAAGLKPIAVESTTLANYRAVIPANASETLAVIDIGEKATALSIIRAGNVALTHNIPIGGRHFRSSIARVLGIGDGEAEKVKIGIAKLDELQREEIVGTYRDSIDNMLLEIRRSLDFFHGQTDGARVKQVILCGRGAQLYGLADAMSQALTIPVQLADPWQGIQVGASLSKEQLQLMAPAFSVAVGLAMREES